MDFITNEINRVINDFQGLGIYLHSDPWAKLKFLIYNASFVYMAISFARTKSYYFGRSWECGKVEVDYVFRFLFVIFSAFGILNVTYAKSWILKIIIIGFLALLMERFKDKE